MSPSSRLPAYEGHHPAFPNLNLFPLLTSRSPTQYGKDQQAIGVTPAKEIRKNACLSARGKVISQGYLTHDPNRRLMKAETQDTIRAQIGHRLDDRIKEPALDYSPFLQFEKPYEWPRWV